MKLRYPISLLFFALLHRFALAQTQQQPLEYGFTPTYGAVFRYQPDEPKVQNNNAYGFELYTAKVTTGKKYWEKIYNYPKVGFRLSYFDYQREELDKVISFAPYLDFTPFKIKRNFRIIVGMGASYSPTIYDPVDNPTNVAISSHISFVGELDLQYDFWLAEKWQLTAKAGFRHHSNGRVKTPNNGINYLVFGPGIRYVPSKKPILNREVEPQEFDKKIHFNLLVSGAIRQVRPEEDGSHKVGVVSAYINKQVGRVSNLVLGFDGYFFEEKGVIEELEFTNMPYDENDIDTRQFGISFGHELLVGDLSLAVIAGYHLHLPYNFEGKFYQRVGLRYYLSDHIFINGTIKAYVRKADMLDLGVGFRI
ncbi:acyloxyacyl hydrolase [Flammeovirgaceae bacterium SG7u.111]|nr:acyloxyacyl hydrolase [Flammeovirgaceae bacterium SG7u.132]WPO36130.1 acyloxyacyl hydrolase [Flammeovirgaceae bacterium SG7u.111]